MNDGVWVHGREETDIVGSKATIPYSPTKWVKP